MKKYLKEYEWSNIRAMLRNQKLDPEICTDDFNNRLVVITGATSGIGYATARKFAAHGADILSINRNEEKSKELCETVKRQFDAKCAYLIADFTVLADVHAVGKQLSALDRNIDVPQKLLSVLVTNGSHYGGAKISNSSIINDGYFEITIVKSFRELATIFLNKFFKSLTARLDDLEQYHVDYLEIHIPANRYEFHLDGDSFTEHFSTENKLIYRVSDTTQLVVP